MRTVEPVEYALLLLVEGSSKKSFPAGAATTGILFTPHESCTDIKTRRKESNRGVCECSDVSLHTQRPIPTGLKTPYRNGVVS